MELSPRTKRRLKRFLWAALDTLRALVHFVLTCTLFILAFALCATIPIIAGLSLGGHDEAIRFVSTLRPIHWIVIVGTLLFLILGIAATRKPDDDDED